MSAEDEAAEIIADMFVGPVLGRMNQTGRFDTPLYGWETRAVEWLRAYRERGGSAPLNAWAMSYVTHGPPPWPKD